VLNLAAHAPRSRCVVMAEAGGGNLSSDPLASRTVVISPDRRRTGRVARVAGLARTLRRLHPDLVVSMLSPLVNTAGGAVAGVPVMHWVQGSWSRTASVDGDGVIPAARRLAFRAIARGSRLFAVATPGLLQECRALGVPRDKLALLPNGLILPPFPPLLPRQERRRIVSVGRLEPPKRQDLLLAAIAQLSRESELELREQARALGITEHITFTGFVPDPGRYIASADVFALATDHEGFGNVIVEALACGVPTVVSDVPHGPRFILGPTRIGHLVAPGSASALAEALRFALDRRPTEDERLEARRRAEHFTIDRVAERFEALADGILHEDGGPLTGVPIEWP
jgi:glycosyltransferase involved in cell wall biosynthesis